MDRATAAAKVETAAAASETAAAAAAAAETAAAAAASSCESPGSVQKLGTATAAHRSDSLCTGSGAAMDYTTTVAEMEAAAAAAATAAAAAAAAYHLQIPGDLQGLAIPHYV